MAGVPRFELRDVGTKIGCIHFAAKGHSENRYAESYMVACSFTERFQDRARLITGQLCRGVTRPPIGGAPRDGKSSE
jgi:hypothetical protein